LDLPHRQALGRDDFLVTKSNAAAVALIDHWPDWPARGNGVGPPGSGKTHLLKSGGNAQKPPRAGRD
jgi:chromosomal replication initiation ATPase DnaA